MALATLTGTLAYPDLAGATKTITLTMTDAFTERAEVDLVLSGAGNIDVSFGTVTSAKVVMIKVAVGNITFKLDGKLDTHTLNENGLFVWMKTAVTAINIIYGADAQVQVVLLGE